MVLPLYSGHGAPGKYNCNQNTGLWYDKFCNEWRKREWTLKASGKSTPKLDWIKTIAGEKTGDAELISESAERRAALVSALCGELRVFASDWRFVTGLGREHPVENGFAWHHTLGTAYLPGSSVKGLVRAWARAWEDDESKAGLLDRIFGPDSSEKNASKHAGSVIFFDALPLAPVRLETDVMTPHYTEYYRGKEQEGSPPGDWMSPEPIQFLTVAASQEFLFTLAARCPEEQKAQEDVGLATAWLEEALAWTGAGAKTAAGYGRFSRREKVEERLIKKQEEARKQREKEARLQAMSPLRRQMEEDGYSTDENAFMEAMTVKWLKRVEASDTQAGEKAEIASLLKEWYLEYKPKQWKKPKGKNVGKVQIIKNALT